MTQRNDLKRRTEAVLEELNPMQHLVNLDFPRRSGTEGEKQAATYIAQVLEENGYEPTCSEFQYSKPKIRSKIMPPLVFLIWIMLSLANIQFWGNNQIISLVVMMLPLALILAVLNFGRVMSYFSARRMKDLKKVAKNLKAGTLNPDQVITSRNVTAEIGSEDAEKQILLTAHFDSISSKIPMRMMVISMMVGFVGLILYSALYLVNTFSGFNFFETYLSTFVAFALILTVLMGILFASRSLRGNESHGIIDDGTGVAILLELARFVKKHPIPGIKFIFGFYGSEESGLIGSTHDYLNREVNKNKLRVISVDMIGEKPPLAYIKGIGIIRKARMDTTFNLQIVSIAESFDIKIEGKNFPYPGSDFAPFMLEGGCPANWIINQSRLIHSKNDQLGNVDEGLVNDALKLLVAYFLHEQER